MSDTDAFIRPRAVSSPALRLVVLPHAGSSGSVYHPLVRHLPKDWDILLLDLPGRGRRYATTPRTDMGSLVSGATSDVLSQADGTPLALFGHSLGAVIGFEVARSLCASGTTPAWLGVSGRQAPGLRPPARVLDPSLSDEELTRRLDGLGGLPDRLDELPEFRDRFLRLVRADLRALGSYRPAPGRTPLPCPLTAFASTEDVLGPPSGLSAWAMETSREFRQQIFPGGHFHFLGPTAPTFAETLTTEIHSAVPPASVARFP